MTYSPRKYVVGKHAIIDLSGCDSRIIRDHNLIRDILHQAARVAQVTVVGHVEHQFSPEGYSAVLVLEESHLSIHTWPEYNYISLDLYSCNLNTNFQAVKDFLAQQFKAQLAQFTVLDRGYAPLIDMNGRQKSRQCQVPLEPLG